MRRVLDRLEGILRRQPWALVLLALIPCAWFAARGVNDLVAARLFAADTEALARSLPAHGPATVEAPVTEANHHLRDRQAIIHRNVFDSDAGCLDCDAATDGGAVEGGVAAPPAEDHILPPEVCDLDPAHVGMRHPEPCDSTAKVLGAIESAHEDWSIAFIQTGGTGPAMPFRQGQQVDNRTVSLVGFCPSHRPNSVGVYVLLRPQGGGPRCFIAQIMPPREAPPPPTMAAPVVPTPAGGGSELASILDQGIERVGANEFNIRRSTVDRILENQAELMRTTRIMPHEEGGRVVGVQLFGVRGNSLLGRLSLQNGDILNRLNGLDIASPDRALEAYSRLRQSDHIQVSVTRNGQPVNIDFNIRP